MKRSKAFLAIAVATLALGAGGCQWTTPYIYKESEFNRTSASFNRELEDRDEVQICYNKRGTTPEALAKMAKDECAKFDKTARFVSNDYLTCPMTTPVRATFSCVTPSRSRNLWR